MPVIKHGLKMLLLAVSGLYSVIAFFVALRTSEFGIRLALGARSADIVRMVRGAGAKEVHMRISCPPTISPCFYGVDTPRKKELIAANNTVEQIRQYIGADSLSYLSIDGLKKACGEGVKTTYCTACYTGKYPTNLVDVEEIQPATVEKR